MHPTPEPRALDMWSEAMEAPVPNLVTEPTEFPCGTLFVTVVGVIHMALATVIPGEPHLWAGSSLFGISVHCHCYDFPSGSLTVRWLTHTGLADS